MTFVTDHAFHIGFQHRSNGKPNQDYTLSGTLNNYTNYTIVSDGCSSGGMTDIGSRLIVLATKRALEELSTSDSLVDEAFITQVNQLRNNYLELYRVQLGLTHPDLLATCLYAINQDESIFINVIGDGVVAIQYENCLVIHQFDWNMNTPYYPAYRQGNLEDSFKSAHKSVELPFTISTQTISSNEGEKETKQTAIGYTVEVGMKGWICNPTDPDLETKNGRLISVALFSDGVEQVDGMQCVDVVRQLLAYKSINGQFAVRRMNRFLTENSKVGRGPLDDISCAVIHRN
ncbi:protein phosphatase 2C domain-containing protein [Candidatus Nomurabacteria bacterium]|nr:protein phosphatase 2C domain-containing protein [Candidatus Kaiserbacteria bacterium]MCB9814630.1 protein phosphatase 2C domain-containing protein [Candidatus Nomurabacteria bacterium]